MGALNACCVTQSPQSNNNIMPKSTSLIKSTQPLSLVSKKTPKQLINQTNIIEKQKKDTQAKFQPISIPQKKQQPSVIAQIQKVLPPPSKISWDSFQILKVIGKGGFGQVFQGKLRDCREGQNLQYAIKRVPQADLQKKRLTQSIALQKRILQQAKCNFITKLHYAFRDSSYLYFVMQMAEGGDTYSLIKQGSPRVDTFKKLGQNAIRFILGCLILGLEYLHQRQIIYRDLKPQNLLIFANGYVKLTDFGLARQIKQDQKSKTEAGTTIYYAPQMVLRDGYNKSIDLWTLGVYSYEMSNCSPPFASAQIKNKQRVKKIVTEAQKQRKWKNPNISDELKDLINSLLKFQPKNRLGYNSWNEVKQHKFFKDFDWKGLEQMKLQSPLSIILERHPLKFENYRPQNDHKVANQANGKKPELPGWTYMGDKKQTKN